MSARPNLTLLPDDIRVAQELVNLRNDLVAVRKALAVATLERNIWREAYMKLDGRLCQLDGVRREEIELRGDSVARS